MLLSFMSVVLLMLTCQSEYQKHVKGHVAKVTPGSLLFVPVGWFVVEHSLNNDISAGVRVQVVTTNELLF